MNYIKIVPGDRVLVDVSVYDPTKGRFLNADTLPYLGADGELRGYNLYAYCGNNPVMYTDPSGHAILTSIIIGLVISLSSTVFSDWLDDGEIFNGSVTWQEYVGSALSAVVSAFGAGFFSSAILNGIGDVIGAAFAGDITSFEDALEQFVWGASFAIVTDVISKKISFLFSKKKISKMLGNLKNHGRVNKRLTKAGFSNLKIGIDGIDNVYRALYKGLKYDRSEEYIAYGFDVCKAFLF